MTKPGPKPAPRPECALPGCSNPVARPGNKYCSKECSAIGASSVRSAELQAALEGRKCAYTGCDKVLVRRSGERLSAFRDRRFCSNSCTNRHRQQRAEAPERVCAHKDCDRVLVRHDYEARTEFERRLFCSTECVAASRKGVPRPELRKPSGRPRKPRSVAKPAGPVFTAPAPEQPWRPASWRQREEA